MRIYATKWALTQGIRVLNVKDCGDGKISFKHYLPKIEWYPDLWSARIRAETMRRNKVKALQRQIKKLTALDFSGEPK